MILSNVEIIRALKGGEIRIDPIAGIDPTRSPFNTTAVDLRLGSRLSRPKHIPAGIDLRKGKIAPFLADNCDHFTTTKDQPFQLAPQQFILGQTLERVAFPIGPDGKCFSARVEGKSSLARCGILVHFTAPTIHAAFEGPITLELINFGPNDFMLYPEMFVCQLIVERVDGLPAETPNQFKGQTTPEGM
jgi:dCTP deaminase